MTYQDIEQLFGFRNEEKALGRLKEAQNDHLIIIEISSSYGATLLALARSADLVPLDKRTD